jgi:hypothetical protein
MQRCQLINQVLLKQDVYLPLHHLIDYSRNREITKLYTGTFNLISHFISLYLYGKQHTLIYCGTQIISAVYSK